MILEYLLIKGAVHIIIETALIKTLAGYAGAAWTEEGLVALTLPDVSLLEAQHKLDLELGELSKKADFKIQKHTGGLIVETLQNELDIYFSGRPTVFTLSVDWTFCTAFQRKVLGVVKEIPWGQLKSYGEIASMVGMPRAARAVGGALGSNRILLVVPCHRVVRSDGSPGGFGSGLNWKHRLLGLEGIVLKSAGRY